LVGDRRVFPDKQWFEAAGELDAYVQVQVQGGRTQWANRIGLPLTQPVRTRRRWAAGELEIELSRFIGARRVMPRHREFIKTGNQHLWTAMRNRGGVVAWSNSLGIEPPEGSRYRRIENS